VILIVPVAACFASAQLHDLNIRVVLLSNGDAHITEERQMDIDSNGTECYIVLGNLNGSTVSDLQVTDETGTVYEDVGNWDIDQSREWKEDKCGIVRKHDGYELCWGLGASGSRTYTTSYVVSSLLRGYSDADGFNYMFVAEGVKPRPSHVRLTIVPDSSMVADSTVLMFSETNAAIWGFHYRGDVRFEDGTIVAESSEPFTSGSAMIVMVRFNKGFFSPSISSDTSFENVKERAFSGSDYETDDSMGKLLFLALLLFLLPLLLIIGYIIYKYRARKKITKNLLWYRDIPSEGNLQWANDVLNAYKYFSADYNNLLSACILRLIDKGAITIDKTTNSKGKTLQHFTIHKLPEKEQQPKLLQMVHDIFLQAAGSDTILEPRELKNWMKDQYNQSVTDSFVQTLHTKSSIYQFRNQQEEVRQLFGLKKFLKEFTLLDERSTHEVALWKDYMIYATLFGIADKVIKEMKKFNPTYFAQDVVAQQMADEMTLPTIYSTLHSSTTKAYISKAEREARASGRGGSSSWGGGGGFSGGGFGGGVR